MSVRLAQEGYIILITIFMPTCKESVGRESKGQGNKIHIAKTLHVSYSPALRLSRSPALLINLGPTQQPIAATSIPAKTSTT
jgi:hypothetical protein